MKFLHLQKKGFTISGLLVSIAIISLIITAVTLFQKNVFSLSMTFQGNLNFQLGARAMLKRFSAEVREISPSSLGAYPIAEASTSEFIFFSDADNDGLKEEIRYFLSGTDLKRGVTKPTGSPLVYSTSTEKISTVLNNISSGTTTIFQYYDANYAGTSTPLLQPVTVSAIRFVQATLYANPDPRRILYPYIFTTKISIRNLKDNL